jgi:protein-disulfide isomerase
LSGPGHKYSRQAAIYAITAARIGKFNQVADVLFRNQQSWGANGKLWDTIARVLTPGEQKTIQNSVNDPKVIKQIGDEVAYGKSKNVNSTPTLIVTKGSRQFPVTGYALGKYELLKSMLDDLAR